MPETASFHSPLWFARPAARTWTCAPAPAEVGDFHAALPDYAPTPLTELPGLAEELEVGRVFVKDESCRLGLPAFKALGASWAVQRILTERANHQEPSQPVTLVTATDGNHGHAVAHMARRRGQHAHIFLPQGVNPAAASAISTEQARITQVAGPYEEAVRQAATAAATPGSVLVQDSAWPGYEQTPQWIVDGYSTLFTEVDAQLATTGAAPPDLLAVPVGVGSLAQAALAHYRSRPTGAAPALMSVEPESAACALTSLARQEPVSVATGETIMAGLNCGTLSSIAWPYLRDGLDAAIAVSDTDSAHAARDLAATGVSSGPCGAASLAGVRAALTGHGAQGRRATLALGPDSTIVLLSTEGTDANPVLKDEDMR